MQRYIISLILLFPLLMNGKVTVYRALVIGLGEQEDVSWGKIHGDNDIRYVVKFLENSGYTDIKTLKNKEATKSGIVNAFRNLADRCNQGDKVYIHYSGHGQLMTDINGDEAKKWEGTHAQWDESWIPYDAYMSYCDKDKGEKHLCDDELALLLTAIRNKIGRKGEIIVAVDACHSGDATSGTPQEYIRGVSVKFNMPRRANTQTSEPIPEQWLTISACRPYELSTEIPNLRVGKLTYAIYSLGTGILNNNRRDLEQRLCTFMKKYEGRSPQNPMVTGRK